MFKIFAITFSFPLLVIVGLQHQNTGIKNKYPLLQSFTVATKLATDTNNYFSFTNEPLPPSLSLEMPCPGDQGMQRSCGAWATVYAAGNYYIHVTTGKPYNDSDNLNPSFIYNQLSKGKCGITSLLDNLKLFKTAGACSFRVMPYNTRDCFTQPDSSQRLNAANFKIKGWQKIDPHNLTLLKKAIAQKKPVIFSIATDNAFDSVEAPFVWKERRGNIEQTHTMVIAGYDDERNAFRVMNSWGTSWGDKGFIWIDYQFLISNALKDAYILI